MPHTLHLLLQHPFTHLPSVPCTSIAGLGAGAIPCSSTFSCPCTFLQSSNSHPCSDCTLTIPAATPHTATVPMCKSMPMATKVGYMPNNPCSSTSRSHCTPHNPCSITSHSHCTLTILYSSTAINPIPAPTPHTVKVPERSLLQLLIQLYVYPLHIKVST